MLNLNDFLIQKNKKLARHGIRSPNRLLPNDLNKSSKWANWGGLDKLTNFGIIQELEFGRFLRDYYSFFLGNDYRPNEVYARYSHCAGTFLSTLCVLNGLFGANNSYSVVDSIRCSDDMVKIYIHVCKSYVYSKIKF